MSHLYRRFLGTGLLVVIASVCLGLVWIPAANGQPVTVNFDNPVPPGPPLNGVFQGIDFGTGQWTWDGPFDADPTNNIFFANSVGTSRTFRFAAGPRVLRSLRVFTNRPGTMTVSDDTGQTLTRPMPIFRSLELATTGWTRAATTVTVSFTEGWALGISDITYEPPPLSGATTVNFDNPVPPGPPLNGVFQGIDFGTGQWTWDGPFDADPTNNIFFANSVGTSRTFRFATGPRVLRSLRVFSNRPGTMTVSDDTGQTLTRSVPMASLELVTTGWTRAATTVRVSFSEVWALGITDITFGDVLAELSPSQTMTVNFDNPVPPGPPLDGVFEGIDFGAGQWTWDGPFDADPTNNIFFANSVGTSRTFRFAAGPRMLRSLRVFSNRPGTMTVFDDVGQTLTRSVPMASLELVTTGWTRAATTVTVSFSEGWALGITDITYSSAP
jgi:hypothetical protein